MSLAGLGSWTSSRSLVTRATAASVLLALLVSGAFVVLLITVSDLKRSTSIQTRSRDVTSATLQLEQVVNQLEVSLRAFVITGDKRFLTSWRSAQSQLPPALDNLNRLLAREPARSHESKQLAALIRAYVTDYGIPLIGIMHLSPAAARAGDPTRSGVVRIRTIRTRLDRLLNSESTQAAADAGSAKHEADRALPIAIGALVAAAGLLVLYGLFMSRRVAAPVREVAEGADRVAAGDLTTRLPERGAAEIHTLTHAFNEMASSIEQGQRELEQRNDKLYQSERLKAQLVSIVSHELRTPLSSILGYASLLRTRDFTKEDSARYLEIIEQQGRRLTSLIDQFLDSESIDTGRIEIDDAPLDLRPVIMHEVRLLSEKTTLHRLEVVMGAGALPVRGDRDRLAQVFGNLIENAIKYSPEGGVVEVVGEAAAGVVRVEVRDQGIGIPAEHQPRIFTKFFRADARESGIAGTGLGLAVSRDVVEAHGGRIGFTSEAGKGSTFWFELPLAQQQDPRPAPTVPVRP